MSELLHPIPYEGKEKYIFVSYSHMDIDRVMPIVNRWAQDGFRVWYDDGISPGTEWPEVIAQHLNDCELFISFLSNPYMDSVNCKREIDFAVRKRKTFLAIFLEETQLSLGVEMQISTVQSVDYYRSTPEEFMERFYNSDVVKKSGCRVTPVSESANQAIADTAILPEIEILDAGIQEAQGAVQPGVPGGTPGGQNTQGQIAVPETQVAPQPASRAGYAPGASKSLNPTRKNKFKILLTILITAAVLLLGVVGVIVGVNVSKSKKKSSSLINNTTIALKEENVTVRVLRKAAKGKEVKKLKLENCTLSVKDKAVWGEVLNDKVYEVDVVGCAMTDEDANAILAAAPNAKTVDFSNNEITGLSFAGNQKLETANLSGNHITNIDKTNFDKLSTLNVNGNELANLDFLQTAIHLSTLSANDNNLEYIDMLKNCALLSKVSLADNNITDVTALKASQETIRELNLANNKIADISPLHPMPKLKKLSVDNNMLTSLYLVGSTELSYLSARNNMIDSLNGDYDALNYIDMADNNLSGDYYFIYATKLKKAFFENNKITELWFYGAEYYSAQFSVYNNPLVKLDTGHEKTACTLYASYNKDVGPALEKKIGQTLYLLDCPYDSRVRYEENWTKYNVHFFESGEMVEKVESLRKDFYAN